MRITNNMLINNMTNYIGNNLTRMDSYQNQLATGKKIQVPSDDPVVAARALKLRTDVAEIDQYKKNVKDAQSWLDITEDALAKIGDVLHKARELSVQGANGTQTPSDMEKIGQEVKQLREQLLHLGNATYAGRYVFSGYKTDTPLVNEATGQFNINVNNTENIKFEIGIGDSIDVNALGGDLFNNGRTASTTAAGTLTGNNTIASTTITAGGNDSLQITIDGESQTVTLTPGVYANNAALALQIQTDVNNATTTAADIAVSVVGGALQFTSGSTGPTSAISIVGTTSAAANLGVSTNIAGKSNVGNMIQTFDALLADLNSGNHAGVDAALARIDVDMNNLLRVRADIGARTNRVELTSNRLESDELNFTKLMSENEDVDEAETIMNLKNEENVYRASLAGGARIIMPTLMDFLR